MNIQTSCSQIHTECFIICFSSRIIFLMMLEGMAIVVAMETGLNIRKNA